MGSVIRNIMPFDAESSPNYKVQINVIYSGEVPKYKCIQIKDSLGHIWMNAVRTSFVPILLDLINDRGTVFNDETISGQPLEVEKQLGMDLGFLSNGEIFSIRVGYCIDRDNPDTEYWRNFNAWSEWKQFQCISTPKFEFVSMAYDLNGNYIPMNTPGIDTFVITTGSYAAKVSYTGTDDTIYNFVFYLYSVGRGNPIYESKEYYSSENFTHTFKGLLDGQTYYIRATGGTKNGIPLDTGYIKIQINYNNKPSFERIYAHCDEHNSVVNYHTALRYIPPNNPDPPFESYVFDEGWINLTGHTFDGRTTPTKILYHQNLEVGDLSFGGQSYLAFIRVKNIFKENEFIQFGNAVFNSDGITPTLDDDGLPIGTFYKLVFVGDGKNDKIRLKLEVDSGMSDKPYTIYSQNTFTYNSRTVLNVFIKMIKYPNRYDSGDYNYYYDMWCQDEVGNSDIYNSMWFGSSGEGFKPSVDRGLTKHDNWVEIQNYNDTSMISEKIDKENLAIFYQANKPILGDSNINYASIARGDEVYTTDVVKRGDIWIERDEEN